jgi:hypothetical protein
LPHSATIREDNRIRCGNPKERHLRPVLCLPVGTSLVMYFMHPSYGPFVATEHPRVVSNYSSRFAPWPLLKERRSRPDGASSEPTRDASWGPVARVPTVVHMDLLDNKKLAPPIPNSSAPNPGNLQDSRPVHRHQRTRHRMDLRALMDIPDDLHPPPSLDYPVGWE